MDSLPACCKERYNNYRELTTKGRKKIQVLHLFIKVLHSQLVFVGLVLMYLSGPTWTKKIFFQNFSRFSLFLHIRARWVWKSGSFRFKGPMGPSMGQRGPKDPKNYFFVFRCKNRLFTALSSNNQLRRVQWDQVLPHSPSHTLLRNNIYAEFLIFQISHFLLIFKL